MKSGSRPAFSAWYLSFEIRVFFPCRMINRHVVLFFLSATTFFNLFLPLGKENPVSGNQSGQSVCASARWLFSNSDLLLSISFPPQKWHKKRGNILLRNKAIKVNCNGPIKTKLKDSIFKIKNTGYWLWVIGKIDRWCENTIHDCNMFFGIGYILGHD